MAPNSPHLPSRKAYQQAATQETKNVSNGSAVDGEESLPPEPGHLIRRELTGGQRHVYRIKLTADQFLRTIVDQQGIDVLVQISGPVGSQMNTTWDFDSESRLKGREQAVLVTEQPGDYLLIVLSKPGKDFSGRYELRIEELRPSTDDDRSLHQARKLLREYAKLLGAGKINEAVPLIERALEIRESRLGRDHYDVAVILNALAGIYRQQSQDAKAEQLYKRALSIFERVLEPDDPRIAIALNNLSGLYWDKSDYANAEPLARRALEIAEKTLGNEHSNVALIANTLAILYSSRGDFTKAELLFGKALAIWEKTFGPDHPYVGLVINNLANIYHSEGDYVRAQEFYERALAIREKAFGPEHSEVAATLNNLATAYMDKGDFGKAEILYKRALAIREKSMGPDHPKVGLFLTNLATLYRNMREYGKAEPLYQRSVSIFETTLGPLHPNLANTLNDLAMLHAAKGEIALALKVQSRANEIAEYHLNLNLTGGSERQKLAYLAFSERQTEFTFALHSQYAPNDPQALDLALTTLLRQKGRGLDAMTDTIVAMRRYAGPQDRQLFDQLIDARSRLASLILKASDAIDAATYQSRCRPLEEKIENLEAELSAQSAEFRLQAQPVTLSAVQSELPEDSVLMEFVIHSPKDPQTGKRQPRRYLAYLLTAHGQPKWADLGDAAQIDQAVEAWRQSLRENGADANRLARDVDERVMRPLRSLLNGTKVRRLLIAPDGLLTMVPFAALVDETKHYLIEHYSISYLTSGRDLFRMQSSQASRGPSLIIAHPLFGKKASSAKQTGHDFDTASSGHPDETTVDLKGIFFRPLPGTLKEALAIKSIFPDASLLQRERATEAVVKQVQSPRILHIATHGFFLDKLNDPDEKGRNRRANDSLQISDPRFGGWLGRKQNALLRSGLALSGANRGGNGDEDGLLTALEIAGLDLWGTKLVVLSACDTALGEVKNGEGVQGLRRALVLAGSETQLISLWAVPDEYAKEIMIPYYRALQRGEGRGDALRQAQLQVLRSRDRRHPFYWATFIQSGDWRSLSNRP